MASMSYLHCYAHVTEVAISAAFVTLERQFGIACPGEHIVSMQHAHVSKSQQVLAASLHAHDRV